MTQISSGVDISGTGRKRLLLVVIDGLGSDSLRRALAAGHAPYLQQLMDAGARFDDAIAPFPSLTPVCLSSIITGAGPDRHRIPSLGWYNRGRGRFTEYGSSFAAAGVEGHLSTVEEVVLNLNMMHLAEDPPTLFERVQDAGLHAASINYLVWRGRTRHTMKHDYSVMRAVGKRSHVHTLYGPDHFFFGELFGSSRPRLPQVGIKRPLDWGGGRIARHIMQTTDTHFTLLYLGQHDSASHKLGPGETQKAIRVADRALGKVMDSWDSVDAFLADVAVMVCADHGQTQVTEHVRLEDVFDDVTLFRGSRSHAADEADLALVASNRFAMVYRTRDHGRGAGPENRWISDRLREHDAVDLTTYLHEDEIVVQRGDAQLRARLVPGTGTPTRRAATLDTPYDRWHLDGDLEALDLDVVDGIIDYSTYPDALARLWSSLHCINTGDVLVSAVPGIEFTDIGGNAHSGGSHGSLHAIDSTAPLLTIGLQGDQPNGVPSLRLTDIAALATSHLDIPGPRLSPVLHPHRIG